MAGHCRWKDLRGELTPEQEAERLSRLRSLETNPDPELFVEHLEYHGYCGVAEYGPTVARWHGTVVNVARAVLSFEAARPDELARELGATIDDDLVWCAERGWTPEPPRGAGEPEASQCCKRPQRGEPPERPGETRRSENPNA
jgi:hypothetical protein